MVTYSHSSSVCNRSGYHNWNDTLEYWVTLFCLNIITVSVFSVGIEFIGEIELMPKPILRQVVRFDKLW